MSSSPQSRLTSSIASLFLPRKNDPSARENLQAILQWSQSIAVALLRKGPLGVFTIPIQATHFGTTAPATTTPTISAVAVQLSTTADMDLYVPVTYAPAYGATASVAVALGPTSTPPTIFTNSFFSGGADVFNPGGTAATFSQGAAPTLTQAIHVRVPAGWYVSMNPTGATLGTAKAIG